MIGLSEVTGFTKPTQKKVLQRDEMCRQRLQNKGLMKVSVTRTKAFFQFVKMFAC